MYRKLEKGFSLIELVIVLLIIGIMAMIAVPNFFSWRPNMRLKAAARDLYSHMQKARMLAVKTNKRTAIIFNPANKKYDICDNWNSAAVNCAVALRPVSLNGYKSGIGYGQGNATAAVPGGAIPGDNVSYATPNNTVVFNSQGLSNGGYVYLDHKKHTTTYAVGSRTSGVIKLLKWNGTSWK